jgi:hypothetical protein
MLLSEHETSFSDHAHIEDGDGDGDGDSDGDSDGGGGDEEHGKETIGMEHALRAFVVKLRHRQQLNEASQADPESGFAH